MIDAISLAGPLATIAAAAAAVCVTWRLGRGQQRIAEQQAATARQQADLAAVRLQHDLFDRRFQIYEAARNLLIAAVRHRNIPDEVYATFQRGTEQATFLVDAELVTYLTTLRERATRLMAIGDQFTDTSGLSGEERKVLAQERGELLAWFVGQFHILIEKFKPALVLDDRTRRPRNHRCCRRRSR